MSGIPENNPPAITAIDRKVPEIPWQKDNGHLIWLLLNAMEENNNRQAFLGKKFSSDIFISIHFIIQNTLGMSKAKICKQIGLKILPQHAAINAKVVGDCKTGEGLQGNEGEDKSAIMEFYIAGTGPDDSTPVFAQNLWGVGPNDPRTRWTQPPNNGIPDHLIDPALLGLAAAPSFSEEEDDDSPPSMPPSPMPHQPQSSLPRAFAADHTNALTVSAVPSLSQTPIVSAAGHRPKLSLASHEAVEKLTKNPPPSIPHKCTALESMLEISKNNFDFMHQEALLRHIHAK
ncbi:hypothetical protein BDQ12DRAFT_668528 [Crucibulum laeve]|uniref:Uncharacterized protein n=1 Tax=Crucibulum laeve TaxID=68775 RepID=A0A5C3LTL6_9AGAR|nr:hypothetical protein BDQ12DRAFT_668528 [Crucibulum laeve]